MPRKATGRIKEIQANIKMRAEVKKGVCIKREPNGNGTSQMTDKSLRHHIPLKSSMGTEMAKECLKMQKVLVGVSPKVINQIMQSGTVVRYKKGQPVTSQGDSGDSAFFILRGKLEVLVNNRKVAERKAKDCVGEMSVLDPTQNRCATLVAGEETDLLRVPSSAMEKLFSENLTIVRNVAVELCARLRERSKYHESPNSQIRIFIGSSSEGLAIAKKLSQKLHDFDVRLWSKDVFNPSESNIEALVAQAQSSDFAILVLTPDDLVRYRGKKLDAPRDNVIFELGLFMGTIGRDRTYLLTSSNEMKIPTDLDGVSRLCCKYLCNGKMVIADAAHQIMAIIERKGVK